MNPYQDLQQFESQNPDMSHGLTEPDLLDPAVLSPPETEPVFFDSSVGTQGPKLSDQDAIKLGVMGTMATKKYTQDLQEIDVEKHLDTLIADLQSGNEERVRTEIANRVASAQAAEAIQDPTKILTPVDRWALERAAVEATSDNNPTPELYDPNVQAAAEDTATKMLIMQGFVRSFQDEAENASMTSKIIDWAAAVLPFNTILREANVGTFDQSWDPAKGTRYRNMSLMELPLDEFKAQLKNYETALRSPGGLMFNNPQLNAMIVSDMADFTEDHYTSKRVLTGIDAVASLPPFPAITGTLRALRALDRGAAVETAIHGMENHFAASVVSPAEVANAILPGGARLVPEPGGISLGADINRALEAQQAATLRMIRENTTNARLTPDQIQAAGQETFEEVKRTFKNGEVVDWRYTNPDADTGVNKIAVYQGKPEGGGGYATESTARQAMVRRGVPNASVELRDGQWYIRSDHEITELGRINIGNPADIKQTTFASILNPHTWLPRLISDSALLAGGRRAVLSDTYKKVFIKPIQALKNSELSDLNGILTKGRDEVYTNESGQEMLGKWYNPSELDREYEAAYSRLPTEKEKLAYYSYKNASDLHYALINQNILTQQMRAGLKKLKITSRGLDLEANGKIVDKFNDALITRNPVYHATGGGLIEDPQEVRHLIDTEGYRLVRLEKPTRVMDDAAGTGVAERIDVKYILAKQGDITESTLDRFPLAYRPGGRMIYPSNMTFIKQQRIGKFSTGREFIGDPRVITAGTNHGKVLEYLGRLEEARKSVLAYKATAQNAVRPSLQEVTEKLNAVDIADPDHWDELVREGTIAEDVPFEAVADGQKPSFGVRTGGTQGLQYDLQGSDIVLDDPVQYSINKSRPYLGRRSEQGLVGLDGEKVQALDPLAALDKSMKYAVHANAYQNLRIQAIEGWVNAGKDVLENSDIQSAFKIFENPVFKQGADPRIIKNLLNVRASVMRQMSIKTLEDRANSYIARDIARWIEGKTGVDAATSMDIMSKDFPAMARGFAFHLYLGLFNVAQLPLQLMTSMAAVSVHPVYGAKAARMFAGMRMAYNAADDVIQNVAERTYLHGMAPADFKLMMQEFRNTGVGITTEDHALLNVSMPELSRSGSAVGGALGDGTRGVKKAASKVVGMGTEMFFHEPERFNRMTAWSIAWQEFKDLHPGVPMNSGEARAAIMNKANALFFDMNQVSKSALQKGVFAVPTQFYQYPMHVLQNMFGPSRFTEAQRARLVLGQILLFGGTGVPLGKMAVDRFHELYKEQTGKEMPLNAYQATARGGIDFLLTWMNGGAEPTAFADRGSSASLLMKTLPELWGEHTISEAMMGASGPAIGGLIGAIWNEGKFIAQSMTGDGLTVEDLQVAASDIARNASGFNNAERAYIAYTTGLALSRKGATIDPASRLDAFYTLMGVTTAKASDSSTMYGMHEDFNVEVKTTMKALTSIINRRMVTDSPDVTKAYTAQIHLLLEGVSPQVRQEVFRKLKANEGMNTYNKALIREMREHPEFIGTPHTQKQ